MFFVAIVDGHIPIVHAFTGEDGKNQSVNGDRYQQLLEDVAWPVLRGKAARRNYWWMQDRAPPHCTNAAKKFLLEKFKGRVISRGIAVSWPAHSPDLNPLDFHFWGEAQQQVYREQPGNIEELIECVKKFAAAYGSSTVRSVAENVVKRARQCVDSRHKWWSVLTPYLIGSMTCHVIFIKDCYMNKHKWPHLSFSKLPELCQLSFLSAHFSHFK